MQVRDSYGRQVVSELPDPMPEGKTIKDYVVEPYCGQADYFESNLKTGNWTIQKLTSEGWTDQTLDGASFIYNGVDSGDYTVANADYDAKVEKLQRQDKQFDMRIQQLSTEQKSVENEMESVKKVIDKNIEETFKTFG